jgi:hypothetical protein
MVAGAEGLAGIDLDPDPAGGEAAASMAAVDDEAAGGDRLQTIQSGGDPVGFGQLFD